MAPEERALVEEIIEEQGKLLAAYHRQGADEYEPQDYQLPFHQSQASNRWFIGGNKSGKSRSLHQECKWFGLDCHPYRDIGARGPIWMCSQSDEKSFGYQQPELEKIIGSEHIVKKYRHPRPMWKLVNDQWIHFKNYSQDVATFESDEIRFIGFDEPPPYDIFEAGWMRRSAHFNLDIAGACTMTQGLGWLWPKVIDPASDELLPDTEWFRGSMLENKYLSPTQKQIAAAGLHGVMYKIRVLGEVLPIDGAAVFDPDVLEEWRHAAPKGPLFRLNYMFGGRWVEEPSGTLWLWQMPKRDHSYIIGCDPAEGLNTSVSDAEPDHDQTSISIFDRHTREFVGEYVDGQIRPDETGERILPALSTWFNGAKIIVERNNHGHTVIAFVRKKCPGRLYRPPEDRTDVKRHFDEGYGHLTTKPSRGFMIDLLKKAIASRSVREYSAPGIRQLSAFVLKSNGRMEHMDGMKDDRVFSRGLCLIADHDNTVRALPDRTDKAGLRHEAAFGPDPMQNAKIRDLRRRSSGTSWYLRISGRG